MSSSPLQEVGVLVVGAGRAAASFVDELRQLGFADTVLVANEEAHAPYDRPPLSKDLLRGTATRESIALLSAEALAWDKLVLRNGVRVTQVDRAAKTATLSSGETVRWKNLLLATGGRARRHAALADADGIHYLRTMDDAQRLQSALAAAKSLTVLGGGFLGLELASTARALGLDVTVVEQGTQLLPRMLPPQLSHWLAQRLQSQGVVLHMGAGFESHAREAVGHRIACTGGQLLPCDLVAVSVGQAPDTQLAVECGLHLDAATGGVLVDREGRSSDPAIFAAGDCASSFVEYFDAVVRTESWQSAEWQGRRAARALTGAAAVTPPVPWFWTDVAGVNLQVLGAPQAGLHWVERHSAASLAQADKLVLMGFAGAKLRYAAAVNAGGDLRALTPLIERGCDCDTAALGDPSQPLRRVVKAQLEPATVL